MQFILILKLEKLQTVPRSYTKVTDTEIVIENEGTYTLNQDSGEIKFTPHPKFVGTGTGVTKQQPDIDYNNKVAGDPCNKSLWN